MTRKLTPSQDLVMEVLAARYRLGERLWTFDRRHRKTIEQLAEMGLVRSIHGTVENTVRASLTSEGVRESIDESYIPPILRVHQGREVAELAGRLLESMRRADV